MATAWFRPKRYGYGVTPANWQGWVFTIGWLGGFFLLNRFGRAWIGFDLTRAMLLVALDVALVLGYLFVCIRKSEGEWRWRWGRD